MTPTVTPAWTICARCGAGPTTPSAKDPAFCQTCLPDPEVAAARSWDAAARHRDALRRAALGRDPEATATRSPAAVVALRELRDSAWWFLGSARGVAHLAVGSNPRSVCGKARVGHGGAAPPGMRGCRLCAASMGLTESKAEMVTT